MSLSPIAVWTDRWTMVLPVPPPCCPWVSDTKLHVTSYHYLLPYYIENKVLLKQMLPDTGSAVNLCQYWTVTLKLGMLFTNFEVFTILDSEELFYTLHILHYLTAQSHFDIRSLFSETISKYFIWTILFHRM